MGGTQYSVLIVDDQDNWRELLTELLDKDFEVVAVRNYMDALDTINKRLGSFHVVVTDMRLKDEEAGNEDGLKLIEFLKERDGITKRIVITGYATIPSERRAFAELMVFDYLEKYPSDGTAFQPEAFQSQVRRAAEEAEKRRKESSHPDVFVLMPFAREYESFYENEIKRTIEAMGLVCRRVDNFLGPRVIMNDIVKNIKEARFILADFSGRNANVFFEVGIAHAIGKSVLLLTHDLNDVPPKLRPVRCILYERSLSGAKKIAPMLAGSIREIHDANYPPLFDQHHYKVSPRKCLALMPSVEAGTKAYEELVLPAVENNYCASERAQQIFNPVSLLNTTWDRINEAELIIADLSGRDADVFYLAGLAYGLQKKLIYLAQNETDLPFDLQGSSCLIYSLTPYEMGLKARQDLTQLVKEMLSQ